MIYAVRQWEGAHDVGGIRCHLERHCLPCEILDAFSYPRYPHLRKGDAVIGLGGPPSVVRLGTSAFDERDDFVAHYVPPIPLLTQDRAGGPVRHVETVSSFLSFCVRSTVPDGPNTARSPEG